MDLDPTSNIKQVDHLKYLQWHSIKCIVEWNNVTQVVVVAYMRGKNIDFTDGACKFLLNGLNVNFTLCT